MPIYNNANTIFDNIVHFNLNTNDSTITLFLRRFNASCIKLKQIISISFWSKLISSSENFDVFFTYSVSVLHYEGYYARPSKLCKKAAHIERSKTIHF
jgi:hypothetical protein